MHNIIGEAATIVRLIIGGAATLVHLVIGGAVTFCSILVVTLALNHGCIFRHAHK